MEEITEHYQQIDEKGRLDAGLGLLEKERSRQIISRYITKLHLKILDVGGAAGVYSFWLAQQGHEVHLGDASSKHIEQAKEINETSNARLASISVIDARDLSPFEDASMDNILLLGPLYHLVDKQDRLKALRECRRVLKKGGTLLAAGINRYASLYDGLSRGLIDDPYFVEIMQQDLKDGQHRNPKNHPEYFTTTIFQLPVEMEKDIREANFHLLDTLPVEGPMWFINDFERRWNDPKLKNELLHLLQSIEKVEASLLMTLHYIVVAEK